MKIKSRRAKVRRTEVIDIQQLTLKRTFWKEHQLLAPKILSFETLIIIIIYS